jgi:hypothetical protein
MTLILNGTDNSATTPAVTGTDTDTGVYYPAANQVALATNGALRLLVNASGQAILNNGSTVNDTALLTIACTAGTGSTTPLSLQVGVDSDGYGALTFRNQSGSQGGINCNTTSISMSGVSGITFKATQVASADANTLDDYEEGTWTPTFSAPGTSFTYSAQSGTYVKVGSIVYAQFYIRATAYSGSNSNMLISNLPFTSVNIGALTQHPGPCWSTTSPSAMPLVKNNSTEADMWKLNTSVTIFTASEIVNAYFVGGFIYRSA